MSPAKDGGPAFPVVVFGQFHFKGMTLRDYFAAAVLTGWGEYHHRVVMLGAESYAQDYAPAMAAAAYKIADAMLRERKR